MCPTDTHGSEAQHITGYPFVAHNHTLLAIIENPHPECAAKPSNQGHVSAGLPQCRVVVPSAQITGPAAQRPAQRRTQDVTTRSAAVVAHLWRSTKTYVATHDK